MPLADQMCPQLRQFAFPEEREPAKELFARDETQHSIPQELKLFVIGRLCLVQARLQGIEFAGLGTVRERLGEQVGTPESMPQPWALFPS